MWQNSECNTVIKLTNSYLVKRVVSYVKGNHIVCYYCHIFYAHKHMDSGNLVDIFYLDFQKGYGI